MSRRYDPAHGSLLPVRYRKRPVVVEAVEYAGGGNLHRRYGGGVPEWIWEAFEDGVLDATNGTDPLVVRTRSGPVVLAPGDWLVRDMEGELCVCTPDVFEATYEPVDDLEVSS